MYFERSGLSSDKNKLAELAQISVPNINQHLKAFFEEGELAPERTIKKYLQVRAEGNRSIQRRLKHYNLDMILARLPVGRHAEERYIEDLKNTAKTLESKQKTGKARRGNL